MPPADGEVATAVRGPSSVASYMTRRDDEEGQTLTPTHTFKGNKRLCYYISRRLVTCAAKDHPNAGRLPPAALEDKIAAPIREKLADDHFIVTLLPQADAATLQVASIVAKEFVDAITKEPPAKTLHLIDRVGLGSDQIRITLDATHIAQMLGIATSLLDTAHLAWDDAFTLKRRGVEARIIIGQADAAVDPVLLRNIHQARQWYSEIIAGQTIAQLTTCDGVSRGRLSRLLDLAFLAPDLLAQITTGQQPLGFTSEWLKTHDLPAAWDEQRALFKTL